MSDIYPNEGRGRAVLGTLIAFGLIVGGWALGAQIKATRLGDRYVTVKGLVERTVKSDLAIWPITYKETWAVVREVAEKTGTPYNKAAYEAESKREADALAKKQAPKQ